ncbi:MAG: hypothetical protein MUP33_10990, partial [Polaromonas sp.]|nr:hypothetical protein [Polaromonas sp.]
MLMNLRLASSGALGRDAEGDSRKLLPMKPLGQIVSSTGLRTRLVLLAAIGLLPLSGLVVYMALKNQQHSVAQAREALRVTAQVAALTSTGIPDVIAAVDGLVTRLPAALLMIDSRG